MPLKLDLLLDLVTGFILGLLQDFSYMRCSFLVLVIELWDTLHNHNKSWAIY